MPPLINTCATCGEHFQTRYRAAINCSPACERERGRQRQRAWRKANPAKTREYDRRYRAAHATAAKQWIERNPDKRRAHSAVLTAKRNGRLKPQPCRHCGVACAQAHHADYSRPLEVVWLCKSCHDAEHWMAWAAKASADRGTRC